MNIKFWLVCFLFGCAAVLSFAQTEARRNAPFAGRTSVNSVLASVDGEPITLLDVVLESGQAERELAGIYSGERLFTETAKTRKLVLEGIILRKLVYREYQRHPFEIPPQMIEAMLDYHAKMLGGISRAELERKAKEGGTSIEELREKAKQRIAVDVILIRDCDKRVSVTPKEVYDEYLANPGEWTRPGQIDFRMIQISKEGGRAGADVKSVAARLEPMIKKADPALFEKLVLEYSDASNREKGGAVEAVELRKLRPEFQTALKDRTAGDTVGPVETPEALFFLRVTAIRPASRVPFSKVSGQIYERLKQSAIEKKRAEYEKKLREKALIRYFI